MAQPDRSAVTTVSSWPQRFQLQFRAEVFGLTNTLQFNNPGATVSSASRNADGSTKALHGYTEITGAAGERQLRRWRML